MKLEILFHSGATKVFESAYSTLEEMQIDLTKAVLRPNEIHVMRFIDGWVWTREIAAIRVVEVFAPMCDALDKRRIADLDE